MGENSKIEWTHHTFNPWRGCTKVSPGCAHCYAETQAKRNPLVLGQWGPTGKRIAAAELYWLQPLKWNRAAEKAGERHRVFCASMADLFEIWDGDMLDARERPLVANSWWPALGKGSYDRLTMDDVRWRVAMLIKCTPHLDWLVLTKRIENVGKMMTGLGGDWPSEVMPNLWLGTSVEDQQRADERILILLQTPAAVRFLSCEPLLGELHIAPWLYSDYDKAAMDNQLLTPSGGFDHSKIDWVIIGGESGPGARPCHMDWIRSLVQQCDEAGVFTFVKQAGAAVYTGPDDHGWGSKMIPHYVDANGKEDRFPLGYRVLLKDKKGGDMAEWPEDLRVREFPCPAPQAAP